MGAGSPESLKGVWEVRVMHHCESPRARGARRGGRNTGCLPLRHAPEKGTPIQCPRPSDVSRSSFRRKPESRGGVLDSGSRPTALPGMTGVSSSSFPRKCRGRPRACPSQGNHSRVRRRRMNIPAHAGIQRMWHGLGVLFLMQIFISVQVRGSCPHSWIPAGRENDSPGIDLSYPRP